jgi:hypothetical protein
MLIPRLNHVASLLPTNKIIVSGGFSALGGAISLTEGFDVKFSSWQDQRNMSQARGDHAVELASNNYLYAVGGTVGTEGSNLVERRYLGTEPDVLTPNTGDRRRPEIVTVDRSNFLPGAQITVTGNDFRGRTEAAGGGGGTGNSSFHHPRLMMQRVGGSGLSSANDASFLLDLSSGVFHNQLVPWANINSSMTFAVPGTSSQLPLGWYALRVVANGQYSDAEIVQVAPDKPALLPGTPFVTDVYTSSVVWNFAGVTNGTVGVDFDGYAVYSATNGVFIGTVTHQGTTPTATADTQVFVHRNLGPDTSSMIKIAAYNIAGDGPIQIATTTALLPDSTIANLTGTPQSPTSIFWSWSAVSQATSYEIIEASNTATIGTATSPNFSHTGLSTNTAVGVRVRAILPGGNGKLSAPTTVFTEAAPPIPGIPPVTSVSTGGFSVHWRDNLNPAGTQYSVRYLAQFATEVVVLANTDRLDATITNSAPNLSYELEVQAFNGDGVPTGFVALGTTVTIAAVPGSPIITDNEPSALTITWDTNGNHSSTEYRIRYSTDDFQTNFSTHRDFGDGFFASTVTLSSLITGQTYYFRIAAIDQFGKITSERSTFTVTNNGGGPSGSIVFTVPKAGLREKNGSITQANGNVRALSIDILPNTFASDTQLFITPTSDLNCGAINAEVTITPTPAVQPLVPFELTLQYFPGDIAAGASTSNLSIVRWDPISGTCVPMPSVVNTTAQTVTAKINHLSTFQLSHVASNGNLRVYPNPLYKSRAGFGSQFQFDGLSPGSSVRVYTIHGGLVHEATADARGMANWDATNRAGRPVASGLYIAIIDSNGSKQKTKLVVIR